MPGSTDAAALLLVDGDDAVAVLAEVKDDGLVGALAGQAGAATAVHDRQVVLPTDRDRLDRGIDAARDHDADRHLPEVRRVGGVRRSRSVVEPHLTVHPLTQSGQGRPQRRVLAGRVRQGHSVTPSFPIGRTHGRDLHAYAHVVCCRMNPDERDRLAEALLVASRALVAIAVRSMSASTVAVTVVQYRVLVLLESRGKLSVTAIADELGVDQSNASRHCSRLTHLGLVNRARSAHDGRAVDVVLTAAGRHHVQAVRRARRREIARVLDRMPDDAARAAVWAFEQFDHAAEDERSTVVPTS